MPDALTVSAVLPASPQRIYNAWLSGEEHAAFTGSRAEVDPSIGGRFSAWDGYITGTTQELEPDRRIVQAWRAADFPEGSPDAQLEVLLEPDEQGARITLVHTNLPEGQGPGYEEGWLDYYFKPMVGYFTIFH